MREILLDIENGKLNSEYQFGNNINFPFDYSVLRKTRMSFVPMIASIGCRYKCSYCCYPPIYNGHYNLRKVEYVISDLKQAVDFNKPIAFLDANLYNNREYLISLCNRIIDEKISMTWGAQCTVNVGDDTEVLNLLYKSGCRMIFLGLETLDNKNLNVLNKPLNADHYSSQVSNIHRAGIHIGAFFMLGLDEDDSSTFDKVYSFFQKNRIEIPYAHIYFPIPGTSLAANLKANGRILEDYFDDYLVRKSKFSAPCSVAYFAPSKLSKIELEKGFLKLFKQITSFKNIFRRIFVPELMMASLILKFNLEARRKYKSMVRNARRSEF